MNENSLQEMMLREKPWNSIITDIITKNCFVNIGIITKIHNDNYIDVSFYYDDSIIPSVSNVRLLQLGTTKCKVFIQPAIGDNVLLLCPKDFIQKLVYNPERKPTEILYNFYSDSNMCAILVKDESDDNVKTTVNIDANGNISVTTEGEANVSANNIVLNGGEQNSHLVRYEELEEAVNKFMTALNTHTHTGVETGSGTSGAPTTMQFDISKAKVPTVLTEKASS